MATNDGDYRVVGDTGAGGTNDPGQGSPTKQGVKKGRSSSLVRLTAVFAGGNLIATVLRLLGGVLTSRAMEPAVLGLFNGIGLVMGYIPFLQLGVLNGLNRDLPFFAGKDDDEKVESLAAAAEAWTLTVCGVAVVGLLVVAAWHGVHGRWQLALGWAAYTVPVIGSLYGQKYIGILYRAYGRFTRLSFINVAIAAAGLGLVLLVWFFGFTGLCLRVIGIWGLTLALFWKWRPLRVRPRWSFRDLRFLARTGLPIFAVGQLYAWWPVLNSTLVLKYAGTEGLGLFAIANLAGPTVAMFPQALGQVVYPRMAEEYGRGASVAGLIRLVAKPTLVTVAFTSVVVVVGWFLTPPIVRLVLPKYIEGIAAAQWSVVGAVVLALTPVNNVFNVVKRQGRYGLAMVAGMLVYYVTLQVLIRDGVRLEAFPQAMIVGRVAFVGVSLTMITHLFWRERRGRSTRSDS